MATEAGTAYIKFQGDFSALATQTAAAMAPGKFGKLGRAAGGAFVAGIAAAGIGKALFDVGAEFDEAYDRIRTNTGKTGKELRKLKGDFRDVVGSVPVDFDDASKAVSFMHQRLDIMGKPLQKISKQMLELSRITETDLQTNMEEATRVLADFGVKVQKQPRALDRLFKLTQATGVGFSDLASQMVKFGSPLRQLGFDFNTTAALFAKFTKEGVNIRTALPGLRLALGAFAEAGRDPAKALDQLLLSIKKAGSAQAAYQLQIKGLGSVLEIFGKRAGSDLVQAVQEGRFAFGDLVKEMKDGSKEGILPTAKRTHDAAEEFKVMTNRLKLLIEMPARKVFKGMGDAVAFINRQLKTGGKGLPKWVQGMAAVAKVFVRLNTRLLPDAIKLFKVLASGPSGIEVVKDAFRSFGRVAGKAFDFLKDAARAAARVALGAFSTILDGMASMADAGSKIPGPLGDMWDKVQAGAEDARDAINKTRDSLKDVDRHKNKVKNIGDGFQSVTATVNNATRKTGRDIDENIGKGVRAAGRHGDKYKKDSKRTHDSVEKNADRASSKQAKELTENNRKWVNAVLGGHNKYAKEANKQFKSLGVKESIYATKVTGLSESGRTMSGPGNQRGGFMAKAQMGMDIPGSGSGDKVHMQAMVEPGEKVFVLNRNASNMLKRLENLNAAIPRFAQGGAFGSISIDRSRGHLVSYPGSTQADNRIVGNLQNLQRRFKLSYGDIYAATGHAASGEHPLGLAADIYPGAGGSWTLIDRLAHMAEPSQNAPVEPFRWVGYDGDVNHGRGNHLHLSWEHGPGMPASFVKVFGGVGGTAEHLKRLVLSADGQPSPIPPPEGGGSDQKRRLGGLLRGYKKGGSLRDRIMNRWAGQMGLDRTWLAANAMIDKHSGGVGPTAEYRGGIMSPQAIAALWTKINRGLGSAELMARVAMAESSGNPSAVGHDPGGTEGLGLWQITTGFNDATIRRYGGREAMLTPEPNAQAAGAIFRSQGIGAWAASGPWRRGGLIPMLAAGGLIPRLRNGGTAGGGDGNGFQVPGFGNGPASPLPLFLRKIKKGIKEATTQVGEFIGFLINDDSEWGLPDFAEKGMLGVQRQSDFFAEHAGIANTLTREQETPAGTLTILGKSGGADEGHWLNQQLAQLKTLQTLLLNADLFIAGVMKRIQTYIAYAKEQLRIRQKYVEKLKEKLADTKAALKEAKKAAGGAKGDSKKQADKNVKHLEARETFFEAELKGESAVVKALADPIGSGLDSELSAGFDARSSIDSSLVSLQGFTGGGGTIFDVSQAKVAFDALKSDLLQETESEAGADDSEIADILRQLLDEERRARVIERVSFQTMLGFPRFQEGGVVPGPRGAARTIVAHGGETVLTEDQARTLGGRVMVQVVVEDGAVDPNKIRSIVRDETRFKPRLTPGGTFR